MPLKVLGTSWAIALLLLIFVYIRTEAVYRNRKKVIRAIHMYSIQTSDWEGSKLYDHMESYGQTMLRIWDWGYRHILPEEYYLMIEPYIPKNRE